MKKIEGKWKRKSRISTHYECAINGKAVEIIKLFSPSKEVNWVPSLEFNMIYSNSNRNEINCIFEENVTSSFFFPNSDVTGIWYTTKYSTKDFIYNSIVTYGDIAIGNVEINLQENGDKTILKMNLTITAINDLGENMINGEFKQEVDQYLKFVGENLKFYCENGQKKETKEIKVKELRKFEGKRLNVAFEETVGDNIDMCFSLPGGEEEERWFYGWASDYELLYKNGGAYEKDALFREKASTTGVFSIPDKYCYWYATIHDPETYTFECILVIPGLIIGNFQLQMEKNGENETNFRLFQVDSGPTP